ncbi:MAG: sulfatase [Verrucomicrobia bacterium]|nr:sulfatase [Verrucomicrobiota bacterium]
MLAPPFPFKSGLQRFLVVSALFATAFSAQSAQSEQRLPNFVILFADDLGYGDLGCYGHPTIRTPNLDRMAAEGLRFTDFYSAASVCTPSRAALLTGRYPVRNGMCSDTRRVLFPDSAGGLPQDETTLAEALKTKGYATACIGKWHLGHLPQYLPTRNGFDYYFGLPYSNDMDRVADAKLGRSIFLDPKVEYWKVPLLQNAKMIEQPAHQPSLTRRYTAEAIKFIGQNRSKPFLLYVPYAFPHVPLFASDRFAGQSPRGLYGDVVEEMDWSAGEIMASIRKEGIAEHTLVFFSSDNGPWLLFNEQGGSAGLLREGKGSTWEGGMRVPGLAWWPGKIKAGAVSRDLACTMDIFSTCLSLAGASPPSDREIDGVDLGPVLFGKGKGRRDLFFYYRDTQLYAVRKGPFKAHFMTRAGYGDEKAETHDRPLLFHLGHDPAEKFDVAKDHPDVLADLAKEVERHRTAVVRGPLQLEERIKSN